MRILYESVAYPPYISGTATFVHGLMRNMRKGGHRVGILTPALNRSPGKQDKETIQEYFMPSIRNPWRLNHATFMPLWKDVIAVIDEFKPDIIHFNDPFLFPVRLADYARKKSIPTIMTQHAYAQFISIHLQALPAAMNKPLMNAADFMIETWLCNVLNTMNAVTTPTDWLKNYLIQIGVEAPKIHVFSNGVDLSRFQPPAHKKLGNPTFLFLGRIDKDKSLDLLIKAMARVRSSKLLLAGAGGTELDKLKKLIDTLNLEGRVSILGKVSESKMVKLYQEADVFVMPSTVETQSIATLQAMASGLPIVACRAGALPHLVEDGINGFLFDPFDEVDLANKIELLLDDERMRKSMGNQSRMKAEEHEINAIYDRWHIFYTTLAEKRRNIAHFAKSG